MLLDHSVPASAVPAVTEAVTNAAGIQTKRGDTISIGQVAFAKPTEAAAGAAGGMIGYAKYVLLVVGAILFLFFTTRALRKREKDAIEEPVWLREIEAPVRLSELERESAPRPAPAMANSPSRGGPGTVANGHSEGDSARRQVEQLVDSNPDRVAQQLRAWMQEE